jgi:hypothetical protein
MRVKIFVILLATALCSSLAVAAQDLESLNRQAWEAYEQKRYAESARLYAQVVEKGATNPTTFYNAACSAALAGDKEQAFRFLDGATSRGWRNLAHIKADADLTSLHDDPRWQKTLDAVAANERKYLSSINAELYKIYTEDQGDRAGGPDKIDWAVVSERDRKRRARVLEIVQAGELKAADDYYHAAMVFQHGNSPDDYQRAHELASKAAELDPAHPVARWLAAASKDRYLWSVGKPQIYGTQFKKDSPDGKWTIEPIDEAAVTDEERRKSGVPTLAETKRRLETMNAETNQK